MVYCIQLSSTSFGKRVFWTCFLVNEKHVYDLKKKFNWTSIGSKLFWRWKRTQYKLKSTGNFAGLFISPIARALGDSAKNWEVRTCQFADFGFFNLTQDMKTIFVWGCLLTALIEPCMSNLCLHFPPGSNNRLNTADESVSDPYRLFNSQVIYAIIFTVSINGK